MKNLKLKSARAALDMSQQELAEKVGVSRQTINAIEKGDYNPTINLCRLRLCGGLHGLQRRPHGLFAERAAFGIGAEAGFVDRVAGERRQQLHRQRMQALPQPPGAEQLRRQVRRGHGDRKSVV